MDIMILDIIRLISAEKVYGGLYWLVFNLLRLTD